MHIYYVSMIIGEDMDRSKVPLFYWPTVYN